MSILKTGLGAVAAAPIVISVATPASAQYRNYRGDGGAALAGAAVAGIVGTAIAVGAANSYYNDGYGYDRGYGYGGSPYDSYNSYGGGPGYYSPRAYSRYGNSPNSSAGPGGYNSPSRW